MYSNLTKDQNGIGYGDLFLNGSWNPVGSAPYVNDGTTSTDGTKWSLAFSLNDRWSNTGGTGSLYAVNDNILLAENFMSGGTYRNKQEVAIDPKDLTSLAAGSWTVAEGKITFTIPYVDAFKGWSDIAIHWAMTCGNDVIEGSVPAPVPEPATMLLLGTGLIGLAGLGRKKMTKK
jgi:hypothetical protein